MEFKTVNGLAESSFIKGYWKPLFKTRFNDNYFDYSDRDRYERELRKEIFIHKNCDIVVTSNTYPFNLGEGLDQLIFWVKDIDKDPGINNIANIVEKIYPGKDYNVIINTYEQRSIKTILHYHAILKIPSMVPVYLEKMIIFHRHGNREPITKFPNVERSIGNFNPTYNPDAKLLPIGHTNSIKFGSDLRNIYKLSNEFLSNVTYLTSPYTRCRQTIEKIIYGLKCDTNETIFNENMLKFCIEPDIYKLIENIPEVNKEFKNSTQLFNKLNRTFETHLGKKLIELYDFHSTIKCYYDMGINMRKFISDELENELNFTVSKIYNLINKHYQMCSPEKMKNIISSVININSNIVFCSTHDNLVFVLAKYFSAINNVNHDLELPHYLSNIRIEKWSDGVIRIYYNNYYLGNMIE